MTARQIAFLVALGITVMTLFYLLGLLLVTDSIFPMSQAVLAAPMTSNPAAQANVQQPVASPPPTPTLSPEDQLLVTDPRLVALNADDVSASLKVTAGLTRYFDNAKIIDNSATPNQAQDSLHKSGRLNGFQIAFTSEDPATSELSAAVVLNFTESYETAADAERALLNDIPALLGRFPPSASLTQAQEIPTRWQVGRKSRVFEGWWVDKGERTPSYAVFFCRKNVLTGVLLVGMQREKLLRDVGSYSGLLDKRIKEFGRGSSA